MSASAPVRSAPFLNSNPSNFAGFAVNIRTVSLSDHPMRTIFRSARSSVSVLPGKLPFRIARHAVDDVHIEFAQAVLPVGHSRGGNSVAHQNDAARPFRLQQHTHRRFFDVHSVGDQLRADFRAK